MNVKSLFFILMLMPVLNSSGTSSHHLMNTQKPKITYVFDPMCGWCYGFSKVMDRFATEYKDSFQFEIISGGMVVGEREGPVGDFADYILGAYKRVEEYSGITFGEAYLAQLRTKKLWSSSVTPAIAIETFKQFKPEEAIFFASSVQYAYFFEGKDLRDEQVYIPLVKKYGIDEKLFMEKMKSAEMKQTAEAGFQQSSAFGVSGFPCVIMEINGKYYALTRGFTDFESLKKTALKASTL